MKRLPNLTAVTSPSLFISMASVIVNSSCAHKDILFDDPQKGELRVVYDWRNASDADPEGMRLFFYSGADDTGYPLQFDLTGKSGGSVSLPPGRYHVVSYNNDCEFTRFNSTENLNLHHATTREGDILEPLSGKASARAPDSERVFVAPDKLWGCTAYDITVPDPKREPHTEITLAPLPFHCHYTIEIRNVTHIDELSRTSASLSGLSPSVIITTGELGDESVTIPFEAHADRLRNIITGEFLTFGHREDYENSHRLNLYVWMSDGNRYLFGSTGDKFDVTAQVDTASDRRHVHIIVDGLDLPVHIPGGMTPRPDDWIEVPTDVII